MQASRSIPTLLLLISSFIGWGQGPVNPALLHGQWPASWISCPDIPQRGYGVYHFRKVISLQDRPDRFIVHISGDNRYRLLVNGRPVCSGPARGDLYNWNFETADLAPFLQAGDNILAAEVWNMGEHAAVAQVSNQTAFLLQGDTEKEKAVNTDGSWKVYHDLAYTPCSLDNGRRLHTYMVIGPGDRVDASLFPWNWQELKFDDREWLAAIRITSPTPLGYGTDNFWTLTSRTIPPMEESQQRLATVRRSSGVLPAAGFLTGKAPLLIPAHTTVSILLDQSYNTVAYPELWVSGGKNAAIKMTYAEALFKQGMKGNRNETEGREIMGNYDEFYPDGGSSRLFRPLWVRTYRYLQLDIVTKDSALRIDDCYGMYTGYPFVQQASFTCSDSSFRQIWETGWRTARLCAGETYFDCPYYEQLQYEGDTRIQALLSLYITGDDRLMRKAITDFYNSRVPEGLTQGRYPTNRLQVIPPFSLFWVSMIHDYFMCRKDQAFVRSLLTAVQGVMNWYEQQVDKDKKMLGPMKWWNFVDWDHAFPNGVPAGATDGHSSILTLQYVYTLEQAADLFAWFDRPADAAHYRALAATLRSGAYTACFDHGKGMMGDSPEKTAFSQHAGIMAVLTGSIPAAERKDVMKKVLYDTTLSQATFYYRFYLTLALKKAGMGNLYYSQLQPWRDMLTIGLTTFAENPDPTRSDCHAWSASPVYDALATLCGITPAAPGFTKVQIAPQLGELQEVNGRMPHPDGEIIVHIRRKNTHGVEAQITLPAALTGEFVWNGRHIALHGGLQEIKIPGLP